MTKQDNTKLRDILLGMEWCHAVKTKSLDAAVKEIQALVEEVIGQHEKPDVEEDSMGDDWCQTCETVVSGIDERGPCQCDIRNQLRKEIRQRAKERGLL